MFAVFLLLHSDNLLFMSLWKVEISFIDEKRNESDKNNLFRPMNVNGYTAAWPENANEMQRFSLRSNNLLFTLCTTLNFSKKN